jgi:hypothetical protein
LETHHKQSLERATYQADIARRRYEEVDPANRLVAAELEKRWEAALVAQRKCEETLNRFHQETPTTLTQEERSRIVALENDFQSPWTSKSTSGKERQDLVRSLIERIVVGVINGTERLAVTVHWAGGYTSEHETRRTVSTFDELEDAETLFKRTQQLYNSGCPRAELIERLNNEGFRPARKSRFTKTSINALLLVLRRRGMIGARPEVAKPFWRSKELSAELEIQPNTLTAWRRRGWVQAKKLGSRWIYWANDVDLPRLKNLVAHPRSDFERTPDELTVPGATMPAESA